MASPYLNLQSDWDVCLNKPSGKVWVTCKASPDAPAIQGELQCSSGFPNSVSASVGFRVDGIGNNFIHVGHTDPNCRCQFVAPTHTFESIHLASITCMDVTPGGLAISACTGGKLQVWETSKGIIRRTLEGHTGEVYTCKFFPSNVVALTGGMDMRIKIWSAETGSCPVTLIGHVGAIMDTAIVARGRNVISSSRDGTARLWDCGQATCLSHLANVGGSINGCALAATSAICGGNPNLNHCEREVETEGKLLLLACEDKTLRAVAVYHRSEIFSVHCTAPVNTCTFLSDSTQAICGCQDGTLLQIDIRNPSQPVKCWLDTVAAICSVHPFRNGFLAGKSDGMCMAYEVHGDKRLQLTGSNCDPIYKVVSDGSSVYTCCRDGAIRKYTSV